MGENYHQENQNRFTHADFVQYLQNIDDMASPPKTIPSQTSSEITSSRSPPVKEIFSPNIKSTTVHRTLKAQISDLELHNKQLTEDLRRATKELDRKGGGAGEGVHWFAASTMKTKLQQMESQWNKEMELRLNKCLSDCNKELNFRLEEQSLAMESENRREMESALMRQAADLNANFDHETKTAKEQYDLRFENVLNDVERHKSEVLHNQEQREKEFSTLRLNLEKELADVTAQLNALMEVEDMGKAADMEANEKRWEARMRDLKDEFEINVKNNVDQAVLEKQTEFESILAQRESDMDDAYAKHLSQTVQQCEAECAEIAGKRLEEVKQSAVEVETRLSQQLDQSQAELAAIRDQLKRTEEGNTETLNRLAGLKSSANEAQQKRLTEKYLLEIEQVRQEEQEKANTARLEYEEMAEIRKGKEIEEIMAKLKNKLEIENENRNKMEYEKKLKEYENNCNKIKEEEIISVKKEYESIEIKLNVRIQELEAEVNSLEGITKQQQDDMAKDLAVLRERLLREKEAAVAKAKTLCSTDSLKSIKSEEGQDTLVAEINKLQEVIRQQKVAHDLLILNQRSSSLSSSSNRSTVIGNPLTPKVWIGASVIMGLSVGFVIIFWCFFLFSPQPLARKSQEVF